LSINDQQAQAWGVVVAGNDLIAVAKTGSGKTLAFLLPIFHALQQQAAVALKSNKGKVRKREGGKL
jgi:superfamily II DNA/RNA helicase